MKQHLPLGLILLFISVLTIITFNTQAQTFTLKGEQISHWDAKTSSAATSAEGKLLAKNFKRYDVFKLKAADLAAYVKSAGGNAAFTLQLGNKYSWGMKIEPENLFSKDAKTYELTESGKKEVGLPENVIYKGELTGNVNGKVRLTITDTKLSGYITIDNEKIYVESLNNLSKTSAEGNYIVYKATDVIEDADLKCQAKKDTRTSQDIENKLGNGQTLATCAGTWENQIATYATYNRYSSAGGTTQVNNEILTILNNVQGNYNEFKVKLVVVEQIVSTCSSCDPWGQQDFNISNLLDGFTSWGPTGFTKTHDEGICFFDGPGSGSVGFAWVGTICTQNKYNVCDKLGSSESNRVLVAHEMGHNFGANHDASGSGFIMAPSVNSTNTWSSTSKTAINNHIASRTCLTCTTGTPTTCTAPSGLVVQSVQATAANLDWNDVSGATGYTVQIKPTSATTWQTLTATSSSISLSGLQTGVAYQWQVKTTCSTTSSSTYTAGPNFTPTATSTTCAAPTGKVVQSVQSTSANLNWDDMPGATSYSVQFKTTSSTTWQTLNTTTSNINLTGLQSGSTYQWLVKTVCSSTSGSAYSAGANFTTTTSTACSSPSGLVVENLQATTATLNWNDVAGATGYVLQIKASGASSWQSFTITTSYLNVSGMQTGTTYQWQVKTTCSSTVSSAYTTGANFTPSNSTPVACASPTGLVIDYADATSASLSWNDVSTALNYTFQIKTVSATTWQSFDVAYSYVDINGMQAGVTYQWRVRSNCSSGSSTYANGPNINGSGASAAVAESSISELKISSKAKSTIADPNSNVRLDEVKTLSLEVYPNPTSDTFTLKFNQLGSEFGDVEVLNISGVQVYNVLQHQVNTPLTFGDKLPVGVYIIRVKTATEIKVIKVIKN